MANLEDLIFALKDELTHQHPTHTFTAINDGSGYTNPYHIYIIYISITVPITTTFKGGLAAGRINFRQTHLTLTLYHSPGFAFSKNDATDHHYDDPNMLQNLHTHINNAPKQ